MSDGPTEQSTEEQEVQEPVQPKGTEPYVCARCSRVLDHDSLRGYVHSTNDALNADHDPEPVPQSQALVVSGRCDICYADNPAWVVPARDFEVMPGHMSDGDWAACADCGALIDKDQWTAVVKRAKASWEERHGPMPREVEHGISRMYRLLRKNMTGSLKPNPAAQGGGETAKYGRGWKANLGI